MFEQIQLASLPLHSALAPETPGTVYADVFRILRYASLDFPTAAGMMILLGSLLVLNLSALLGAYLLYNSRYDRLRDMFQFLDQNEHGPEALTLFLDTLFFTC